jgi:hypothetical protein
LPTLDEDVTIICSSWAREEAVFLSQELQHAGLTAVIVPGQAERGSGEIVLVILLAVPLRTFLEALGKTLGDSAGDAIVLLVKKLTGAGAGKSRHRYLIVRERESATEYELSDDLPSGAYAKLTELKVEGPGRYVYKQTRMEWVQMKRSDL